MPFDHIDYSDVLAYYGGTMWQDPQNVRKYRQHCAHCYQCAKKVAIIDLDYPELMDLIPPDSVASPEHIKPIYMRQLFDNQLDDYQRGSIIRHLIICDKCLDEYMKLATSWRAKLPGWNDH